MFESLLEATGWKSNGAKTIVFPVSCALHGTAVFLLILTSYLAVGTIEPPVTPIPNQPTPDLGPPIVVAIALPPAGGGQNKIDEKKREETPPEKEDVVQPEAPIEDLTDQEQADAQKTPEEEDGPAEGVPGGAPEGKPGGDLGGDPRGVPWGARGGDPDGVERGDPFGLPGPLETEPMPIGPEVRPPEKIVDVKPVYPEAARFSQIEGDVILEAVIDTDGNVTDIKVVNTRPLLDKAAIDAVRKWKYIPARQHGRAVKVYMMIVVKFNLR